ncbi:MAG TPA: hypothetical protein VNN25_08960, partial [Thermoanaerobaculia bacterium]|nr:hypothetical protein [Thermoanaerobaculia bacterium]
KGIDLLVEASTENVRRLKRAMAVLPDNAIELIADDEIEKYGVVRIADEIVVDLLKSACGVDFARAADGGIETKVVDGVPIPVARKGAADRNETNSSSQRRDRCAVSSTSHRF